jgi:glutamyl-tRNA synthetase
VAIEYEPEAVAKFLTAETKPVLETLRDRLKALPQWDEASMEAVFKELAAERGLKLGGVIQPTRVAMTGKTTSPGMYEVLMLLGRELSMQRFDQALGLVAA